MDYDKEIVKKVCEAVIRASSTFSHDKKEVYLNTIDNEQNDQAQWVMETILDNAQIAEEQYSPLCDDTGIPHLILDIGKNRMLTGEFLDSVYEGIREGLRTLPGRPMAIKGNDMQRMDQSGGLDTLADAVEPAPLLIRLSDDENILRLTVLMQGGGPEIRSKTYRVFHKHSVESVVNEIVTWADEVVGQLGCTPCTLAVGIGRSHFEASSLMLQAMMEGNYSIQSKLEKEITRRVNETQVGPLGLGGNATVLGTFLKVGPQRASGVRVVCLRPCCCFEPRRASVDF